MCRKVQQLYQVNQLPVRPAWHAFSDFQMEPGICAASGLASSSSNRHLHMLSAIIELQCCFRNFTLWLEDQIAETNQATSNDCLSSSFKYKCYKEVKWSCIVHLTIRHEQNQYTDIRLASQCTCQLDMLMPQSFWIVMGLQIWRLCGPALHLCGIQGFRRVWTRKI